MGKLITVNWDDDIDELTRAASETYRMSKQAGIQAKDLKKQSKTEKKRAKDFLEQSKQLSLKANILKNVAVGYAEYISDKEFLDGLKNHDRRG